MRYLNGVLCVIMLLFVVVQYNDPDYAYWIVIYGLPAFWAGVATLRPMILRRRFYASGLVLTTLAAAVGMIHHWPDTPGWWRQEVWWDNEMAREGMGMMIVTLVLLVVLLTAWRARQHPTSAR